MNDLIKESPPILPKVKGSSVILPEVKEPPIVKDSLKISKHPANTQPCYWILTKEGDLIFARNDISGDTFEGTMEEFNKMLRG